MQYLRRTIPLALLLLVACSGAEGENAVETDDLTGLYVGQGEGRQKDRICMVSASSGAVRFGIVTLEPDRAACSGIGRVERTGEQLRLIMGGDENCTITATMNETQIALAATVPESCSYYCSPAGRLAGKTFTKADDTREVALRTADLVGNRLCR